MLLLAVLLAALIVFAILPVGKLGLELVDALLETGTFGYVMLEYCWRCKDRRDLRWLSLASSNSCCVMGYSAAFSPYPVEGGWFCPEYDDMLVASRGEW